ncbi:Uncharacterized protein dnm_080340 [Desulfonema magnum]|uniref:Uncharacterized protein n=1 Tax=Desulfonema magnum TaxID=45655 RepID=A0A975GSD7_9BACT|nr:Uncharacterized protein dnm_080340 [Desulfonema magnum]
MTLRSIKSSGFNPFHLPKEQGTILYMTRSGAQQLFQSLSSPEGAGNQFPFVHVFFDEIKFQSLSSPEGAGNLRLRPLPKSDSDSFNPFHLPKEQGTAVRRMIWRTKISFNPFHLPKEQGT